jgi:hypothetical protein
MIVATIRGTMSPELKPTNQPIAETVRSTPPSNHPRTPAFQSQFGARLRRSSTRLPLTRVV